MSISIRYNCAVTDRLDLRRRLNELAFGQAGYFTASQAKAVGYTYQAQKYHVDRGNWSRIDRALFRLPGWPSAAEDVYARWWVWSEGLGVISHESQQPAHQRARLRGTLRGFEKKPMPFLLGQMNLLLHGVDDPKITRGNALTFSAADQRRDGVDVVLTNPPFGGEESASVKGYFQSDYRTTETSWLFLLSVMERITKSRSGRAAVVVPNGVLFDKGIGGKIKKKLMTEFDLHTVVRLPNGTFSPYTLIPTNILFFDRGRPTEDVWFYEHPLPEGRKNYTKTKPLRYEEFAECEAWWGGTARDSRVDSAQAWKVSADDIAADGYNLDLQNPHRPDDLAHRPPAELLAELIDTEQEILVLLEKLQTEMVADA